MTYKTVAVLDALSEYSYIMCFEENAARNALSNVDFDSLEAGILFGDVCDCIRGQYQALSYKQRLIDNPTETTTVNEMWRERLCL